MCVKMFWKLFGKKAKTRFATALKDKERTAKNDEIC